MLIKSSISINHGKHVYGVNIFKQLKLRMVLACCPYKKTSLIKPDWSFYKDTFQDATLIYISKVLLNIIVSKKRTEGIFVYEFFGAIEKREALL